MATRARAAALLWPAYESFSMTAGLGGLALLCLIWLPAALVLHLLLPRRAGARLGRFVIFRGVRGYLRFLTLVGFRFELSELDGLAEEPPLVVVANHPSLIDILLLVSKFPNAACVMKAALMRNVLFGAASRLAGYVPNDGPLEVVLGACAEIAAGSHLIIFPEATRTRDFPLGECTHSAALIAARAGVPIQTLVITFSSPYLGKSWPLFRRPPLPQLFWVRRGRRLACHSDHDLLTRELESALAGGMADSGLAAHVADVANRPGALT
jgi:1-acyl-sn-glycerol-3-phosphate acyltransferase